MADYDVGVLALVVPAKSAPKATYRPAVSVRNNGIHDALASGYLRIYAAGLLVFESELYSATIPASVTGNAQAVDYWTPTAEGFYTVYAYLSTPLDQIESNNMLAPVTIEITGAAPPTPPVVTAHAAQHEEGGTDEVSIDGLQGRTADPQSPLAHAAQHQAGGSDALNVGSLAGVLAQDQPAQVHSNTRHNPVMTTAAELTAHAGSTAVHTVATNLANRDTTGPDTGLVSIAQMAAGMAVPYHPNQALLFRGDGSPPAPRTWGYPKHASIGTNLPGNGLFSASSGLASIISLLAPAAWLSSDMQFLIHLAGLLHVEAKPGGLMALSTWFGADQITEVDFPVALATDVYVIIDGTIIGKGATGAEGSLIIHAQTPTPGTPASGIDGGGFGTVYVPGSDKPIAIKVDLTDAHANTLLSVFSGYIRALHPVP